MIWQLLHFLFSAKPSLHKNSSAPPSGQDSVQGRDWGSPHLKWGNWDHELLGAEVKNSYPLLHHLPASPVVSRHFIFGYRLNVFGSYDSQYTPHADCELLGAGIQFDSYFYFQYLVSCLEHSIYSFNYSANIYLMPCPGCWLEALPSHTHPVKWIAIIQCDQGFQGSDGGTQGLRSRKASRKKRHLNQDLRDV